MLPSSTEELFHVVLKWFSIKFFILFNDLLTSLLSQVLIHDKFTVWLSVLLFTFESEVCQNQVHEFVWGVLTEIVRKFPFVLSSKSEIHGTNLSSIVKFMGMVNGIRQL